MSTNRNLHGRANDRKRPDRWHAQQSNVRRLRARHGNNGLLIKNLEQVTDFNHAHWLGKRITSAAATPPTIAPTVLADAANRVRRELAERLQRLVDPAG